MAAGPQTHGGDLTIAVDDAIPDDDSAIGSSTWSTISASLNSDVVNFPIVNGRRYFAYKNGEAKYTMPNDEDEMDRLDLMHAILVKALGQKLFLAPLEASKVHRALDLGTGTGIWALDFADQFMNCQVLGVDLSPIQPTWIAPNVKFEIDDIESEWNYSKKFDFIMGRYLMNGLKNYKWVIEQAFKNATPGGWVEFQDMTVDFKSDDGTLRYDSRILEWQRIGLRAQDELGVEHAPGTKLEGWFKDVGFVNIQHRLIKLPWGHWPRDPDMKEIGVYNLQQLLNGADAFTLRPFCEILGWSEEEVKVFMIGVRKELKDPRIHGYYEFHVVYGQKPED